MPKNELVDRDATLDAVMMVRESGDVLPLDLSLPEF